MPDKKLTDELLNELLDAPNIDGYIKEHDFAAPSLSNYLKQLLQEKGLERSRVVRMADLNETFGYQIFTGGETPCPAPRTSRSRPPSDDWCLQEPFQPGCHQHHTEHTQSECSSFPCPCYWSASP